MDKISRTVLHHAISLSVPIWGMTNIVLVSCYFQHIELYHFNSNAPVTILKENEVK